jgi:phospholipase C
MNRSNLFKSAGAMLALVAMTQPLAAVAAAPPSIEIAPLSKSAGSQAASAASRVHRGAAAQSVETSSLLTHTQKLALLQKKIKYVFVLFQENRSFDHYFGTYPGANGLFNYGPHPTNAQVPGFTQKIVNTDGSVGVITPFLIPQTVKGVAAGGGAVTVPLYPADTTSVDHSHAGIVNGIHLVGGVALNDRFVLNAEGFTTDAWGNVITKAGVPVASATPPSLAAKQKGELLVAHIDCDTIPILWNYADRFTLFDNFKMTVNGPSTPNAIAMIAGQSGETQMVLHPGEASTDTANPTVAASGGLPVSADPSPFPGSNFDFSAVKPPFGPNDTSPANPTFNLTFASLPLSFMGKAIHTTVLSDQNPALDLADVQGDIATISTQNAVNWGWYQEGYDHEPTDGAGAATNSTYITHHNGPQYFGYLADNTVVQKRLHGLGDFFNDIAGHKIQPGVFYVRGGYGNNDGLLPASPSPAVRATFPGSDDHPGYSDAQISEALLADEVNAIVNSGYWNQSAIIITYDETDGLYDHQPPAIREWAPNGDPESPGSRIPAIVLSPYGVVHGISHVPSEHSSVIKFIDELFSLTPLADLPVEKSARAQGKTLFGQPYLGPADDGVPNVGDLLEAFDDNRLTGALPPVPSTYALVPTAAALTLPQYGGQGCRSLNIVPTDYSASGLIDPAPADFNPRGSTNPGIPTSTPGWPTN